MIGFIRAGVVAIILYVIISVPALVVSRRWMKGLSTSGLTADDARTADATIEELQTELRRCQDANEDLLREYDLSQQLLLELESESEGDSGSQQDGETDTDGENTE